MECNICNDCALRLFNTKGHNIHGVGNAHYGNMIIMAYVDKESYKAQNYSFSKGVQMLNNHCISSTGELITNYCYITPAIKCKIPITFEIGNDIIKRCTYILCREITQYNIRLVMLIGSANKLFGCSPIGDINIVHVTRNLSKDGFIYYFHLPNVFYGNPTEELIKTFNDGFSNWYNAIKTFNFNNYKMKFI